MPTTSSPSPNRQGGTIILMLLLLVIVFVFVGFAIDVGRIQLAQLKLQTASDLAARAGAEAMSRGVGDVTNLNSFGDAVRAEADMLMEKNSLFGAPVSFDSNAQIQFGIANMDDQSGGGGAGGNGNGNGNANGNGNGKRKFRFNQGINGQISFDSNAISVNPDISQFPVLFGRFLGTDNVALHSASTAKIQDRDIVLVIDRSGSMNEHDAGTISVADYDPNLLALEDALYGSSDPFYPGGMYAGTGTMHTEFDINAGVIQLSRFQALKLAILKFRDEIDASPGREQLGLAPYANAGYRPADVTIPTPDDDIDIEAGLSADVQAIMVDNGVTETVSVFDGPCVPHEITASALEDDSDGYDSFDFNYLRTRWGTSTNIADGITAGVDVAYGTNSRMFAQQIVIVMTDGVHNHDGVPNDAAIDAMAAHPDLKIYTITFGTGADEDAMIEVANTGNGRHFHADNVDDLVDAFQDIARTAGVTIIE